MPEFSVEEVKRTFIESLEYEGLYSLYGNHDDAVQAFYFGYNPERRRHVFLRIESSSIAVYETASERCHTLNEKIIASFSGFLNKEEGSFALQRMRVLKE